MELLQLLKSKCLCNDYRADAALLESGHHLCNICVLSRGGGCSSHPGRRAAALQGFCVGLQLAVPMPREPELHRPAGASQTPTSCLRPWEMRPISPACMAWVGEGAAGGPFAPAYVLGALHSPKQVNNREIRLLTERLIATSPRVWALALSHDAPRKGQGAPPILQHSRSACVKTPRRGWPDLTDRQTDRERERERDTERQTQTDTQRDRDTDRQRETQRHRQRETQTHRQRHRQTPTPASLKRLSYARAPHGGPFPPRTRQPRLA